MLDPEPGGEMNADPWGFRIRDTGCEVGMYVPKHVLGVVVPMAGGLPQLGVVDVGRDHLLLSDAHHHCFLHQ